MGGFRLGAKRIAAAMVLAMFGLLLQPTLSHAVVVNTNGATGRYIRVTNLTSINRDLAIGELEAFTFGTTPNETLAGNAPLSSNDLTGSFHSQGVASGIISAPHGADGATTNNVRDGGASTYDRTGVGVFHVVDLGSSQNIGQVRLWQRSDGCCQDRLSDVRVDVLADNGGTPGAIVQSKEYARAPTSSFGQLDFVTAREIRPGNTGVIGVETLGSAGVRFIKVKVNSPNTDLQMGEIEAFLTGVTPGASYDPANDMALNTRGAVFESESGTYQHGFAGSMLDGAATGGAEAWYRTGSNAELVIDLGQTRDLGTIRVWQRGDGCCQERLTNFTVSVLEDNGSGNPGTQLNSQVFAGSPPTNSFASFTLPTFNNMQYTIEGIDKLMIELNAATGAADLLKVGAAGTGKLIIQSGAALDLTNLAGTLRAGQTFNILDFGSISGTFTTITGGSSFNLSQLYITGEITVLPEPSMLLLTLFGIAGLALRRRLAA